MTKKLTLVKSFTNSFEIALLDADGAAENLTLIKDTGHTLTVKASPDDTVSALSVDLDYADGLFSASVEPSLIEDLDAGSYIAAALIRFYTDETKLEDEAFSTERFEVVILEGVSS